MWTYLLGCLITYIICKVIRYLKNMNDWEDIKITWFGVVCSWLSIIVIIAAIIHYFITEVIPKHFKNKKPPKWL